MISKDSLGVVTQTNGLKLHIKIERPPSADSDRSKSDAKPDKKRASTVKRPNTKFRSTGKVIWHEVPVVAQAPLNSRYERFITTFYVLFILIIIMIFNRLRGGHSH